MCSHINLQNRIYLSESLEVHTVAKSFTRSKLEIIKIGLQIPPLI